MKELIDIVREEVFYVENVIGETNLTSFTPSGAVICGGRSPVYKTGFTHNLSLEVVAQNKDCPIDTLKFLGYSPVVAGSMIFVKIPAYIMEEAGNMFNLNKSTDELFTKKNLGKIENAIEITILSDGKSVRTDRSADYQEYVRNATNYVK